MSDILPSTKFQALGLSLLATGTCIWFVRRQKAKFCCGEKESGVCWREIAPAGAASAQIQKFGETDLQAELVTERLPPYLMKRRAQAFFESMNSRRTMRFYSTDEPPAGVVETCIATAGTSPSGAHHQPWFFAVVRSPAMKQQIRELVEAEERINYEKRMRQSWVNDLSSMTGAHADKRLKSDDDGAPKKPYLTEAPLIIAMFKQMHSYDAAGKKIDNYYVQESCGIAAGMLIAALHNVGLATLTSTPMGAEGKIREMIGRPDNEKLFLLMPVGYPAADATVPYRKPGRKPHDQLFAVY